MVATFHIVLKQEEGFDVHDTREFSLALDKKFAIGRASKNQAKDYLLPGKHNVFIDSPVVSREHAIFTVNASAGSPRVFITDTKSMHGTYVNGTPLVPHAPKQLFNGDKLQFGVNVNRNESYFMAYKYTFNAELSNPEPFSRGFTVPEAESEEEEVDFIPSSRGSQLNPLVLDESDDEPAQELEENNGGAGHSEDNAEVTMAHLEDDDTGEIIGFAEDEDLAESDAEDMSSDIESDDGSTGSAPEYDLDSPLSQEAQPIEEATVQVEVPATQVQPTLVEHHQPSSRQWMSVELPGLEQAPAESLIADFDSTLTSLLPVPQVANPWLVDEPATFVNELAPPLPPRPSQKRQRICEEAAQDEQAWQDGASVTAQPGALFSHDLLKTNIEPMSVLLPAADRIQTPPHTELAAATFEAFIHESDAAASETIDVQPPTPTSINSRKRSADEAFEEEIEDSTEIESVQPKADVSTLAETIPVANVGAVAAIPTVEEGPHHQRPIAQPKSFFRRALRAAKVMVPATALGAVFTVTALTTLPESFFTVA